MPPIPGSYGTQSIAYGTVLSGLRFTVAESEELLFSYDYAFSTDVSSTGIFGQLPDGKYYGTIGDSDVISRLGISLCPYTPGMQQCQLAPVFMPWDIVAHCGTDVTDPANPPDDITCFDSQSGTRSGSSIRLAGSGDWFVSISWDSRASSGSHVNQIPEPGTFFLVSLGLAGLLCSSLRRTESGRTGR